MREHRAVSAPSTLNLCAVKKMVDEHTIPTVATQEEPQTTSPERVVWSQQYDFSLEAFPPINFQSWKPRRQRCKEPTNSPDGYMTRREAASYLGVSVRFLEANTSIHKSNLAGPASRRPTWRYKRSDLDAWAAERKQAVNVGRAD